MNEKDLRALFEACDRQGFEYPDDIDTSALWEKVAVFKQELDARLPSPSGRPMRDQDCTHFARISFQLDVTNEASQYEVYFSNFGNMLAIQGEYRMPPQYVEAIKVAADRAGLIWVPEAELKKDYDGPSKRGFDTWRGRFFDFV
jgi:hypothetical protein